MTQNISKQKRAYTKPAMKVYTLARCQQLLVGSLPLDSNPSPYQF